MEKLPRRSSGASGSVRGESQRPGEGHRTLQHNSARARVSDCDYMMSDVGIARPSAGLYSGTSGIHQNPADERI